MLHREFEPPAGLREAIKCLWYARRDGPSPMEVMPDGYAEIIFHFGNGPLSRAGDNAALPSPFLMGLLDRPMLFTAPERLQIIGVRCYPWAVFDLLGLPSGAESVYAVEHPVAGLQARLGLALQAGAVEQAVRLLQEYLSGVRHAAGTTVVKAGLALLQTHGAIPVSQVAAAAHATVRTLERKFKQSSGHTVKDVAGLMRFEQARNHLWRHPDAGLAGLALQLGYTDQSHLSREFKRYSGSTPSAFARQARLSHLYKPGQAGEQ